MIVLPEHKLVFLHIHKNAGSSVRSFLKKLGEDVLSKQWNDVPFRGHVNYRDVVAAAPDLAEFRFFAISRNPWGRLVSAFEWWKSKPDTRSGITQSRVGFLNEFRDFVEHLNETLELSRVKPEIRTKLTEAEAHSKVILRPGLVYYASQASYLTDAQGKIVVDYVPIEDLSVALPQYLTARFGREVSWRQVDRNRNAKADWRGYYTDDTAETVARIFAADVELFKYSFERAPA
ncbi:MAG: sulfotransferase family 2 domain-containing protein [Pseudomonadota bacterium]